MFKHPYGPDCNDEICNACRTSQIGTVQLLLLTTRLRIMGMLKLVTCVRKYYFEL